MMYKFIILIVTFMLQGCHTTSYEAVRNEDRKLGAISSEKSYDMKKLARITVYWSVGYGSDYYSRRGKSSTGEKLIEGVSIAVDPKDIPYFSKVDIPELGKYNLIAVDTGGAVKNDTAAKRSGQKVDTTIDIYFKKKEDAIAWSIKNPSVVTIYINKPKV